MCLPTRQDGVENRDKVYTLKVILLVILSRRLGVSYMYSQLLPCGHLAVEDAPIIQTAAKSLAEINYRHLTEIDSRGTYSVRNKGS